jgi:hypothetical protein
VTIHIGHLHLPVLEPKRVATESTVVPMNSFGVYGQSWDLNSGLMLTA